MAKYWISLLCTIMWMDTAHSVPGLWSLTAMLVAGFFLHSTIYYSHKVS